MYFGAENGNVFGIDANTGAFRWNHPMGNAIRSCPLVYNDKVIISSWDGYLYALYTAPGNIVWSYNAHIAEGSPALANGVVYQGGNDGVLYALSADTGGFYGVNPLVAQLLTRFLLRMGFSICGQEV